MTSDDKPAALIEAIYGAALEPASWPSVLNAIIEHLDAASASLGVLDSERKFAFVCRGGILGEPEMVARYRDHYGRFDPWPDEIARRGVGQVSLTSRVYDPDFMRHSPFVSEYFVPAGLVDSMATALLHDQNFALLAVQRAARRGTFIDRDIGRFGAIAPHVAAAIRLQRGLAGSLKGGGIADLLLDRLAVGVIAVGRAGDVVYSNAAANAILARGDGLKLDRRALVSLDHQANARLVRLLAEVLAPDPGPGGIVHGRRAGDGAGYAMLVAPLRRDVAGGQFPWPYRGALVLVRDEASAPKALSGMLRSLYGLTIEQARLLESLLDGVSLLQHAEQAGVRPSTARFHLRHVLRKTGTTSQSQLMRKVVGDLAGLPLLR
ncbi:MAG: helix-turn-helix transcriptional regulator [Alphaproteobacteria bacterium]|nr:helix-turn-helix transcriptional regulator [Alphaproteobacteria bacterium]